MKLRILSLALALTLTPVAFVALTGCAGDRYHRSTGEYIDDKALTSRVKGALADNEQYKFNDVNVTSYRGTVQLSGFVNTDDQKSKAEDIAESVEGVREVKNSISLKPKS